MKVDYDKFPDIPPGYSTNFNKARNVYQVYRDYSEFDAVKGKNVTKRETIGQIKDGKFSFSKLYLARQENNRLSQQIQVQTEQTARTAQAVKEKIDKAVKETKLDQRQSAKVIYPIEPIVLGALISALSGETDCAAITQRINDKRSFFRRHYPSMPKEPVTHDTVYRALLKVKAEQFNDFYRKIISSLVTQTPDRVIAADGQACRGTGQAALDAESVRRPYMLMNMYDANNRVCLSQSLIAQKTNEITVAPQMLGNLEIKDCIVTADAMNCQWDFVERILDRGADYCLALKANQDKSAKEVYSLFATTHEDRIEEYVEECDLNHDRIESRAISVIAGRLLSEPIRCKWKGLETGCVVRVRSLNIKKTTGLKTADDRYYICSLPPDPRSACRIGEIIRARYSIENRLHWVLDVHFDQDRMQAFDPDDISNRVALNKLALAMLENYRYWHWTRGKSQEVMGLTAAMRHCRNFDNALQCIACSQKLI